MQFKIQVGLQVNQIFGIMICRRVSELQVFRRGHLKVDMVLISSFLNLWKMSYYHYTEKTGRIAFALQIHFSELWIREYFCRQSHTHLPGILKPKEQIYQDLIHISQIMIIFLKEKIF